MPTLRLHCPTGHDWNPPTEIKPDDPATRGNCPLCGEPAGIDSPITHTTGRRVLVALAQFAPPVALFLVVRMLLLTGWFDDDVELMLFSGFILTAVAYVVGVVWWRPHRERNRLTAAASILDFQSVLDAESRCLGAFGRFPLLAAPETTMNFRNLFLGEYRGEPVAVFTVKIPVAKRHWTQTAVVFNRVLEGLSDLELVPTKHAGALAGDAGNIFGFRGPPSDQPKSWAVRFEFSGEDPTGEQLLLREPYLLSSSDLETAKRLASELSTSLKPLRDWVVQVRDGRLLLFQPAIRCRPELFGTMLAATYRVQQIFAGVKMPAVQRVGEQRAGEQPPPAATANATSLIHTSLRGLTGCGFAAHGLVFLTGGIAFAIIGRGAGWPFQVFVGLMCTIGAGSLAAGLGMLAYVRWKQRTTQP